MYKKYLRNISMIFLCAFATFVYFKNDDVKTVKKKANMQTVIFKDQDETLIPVSVDIGVKDNLFMVWHSMTSSFQKIPALP